MFLNKRKTVFNDNEFGSDIRTLQDGTRVVHNHGLGAAASAKTGQGKKGDGLSVHAIVPEIIISSGVANVFATYEFDAGNWGKRILSSSGGSRFALLNGDATGVNETDKISVRIDGTFYVVPVPLVAGQFYSVHASINFITGVLKVSIDGELVCTVDASVSVISKDVRIAYIGTRQQFDTFYNGIFKDLMVFKSSDELSQEVIRNCFKNPEFALFIDKQGDLASASGIPQESLDDLTAGVDSFWYSCGETLNATSPDGSVGFLVNDAVQIGDKNASKDGFIGNGDGVTNAVTDYAVAGLVTIHADVNTTQLYYPNLRLTNSNIVLGETYLCTIRVTGVLGVTKLRGVLSERPTKEYADYILTGDYVEYSFITNYRTAVNDITVKFDGTDATLNPFDCTVEYDIRKVSAVEIQNFTADVTLDAQRIEYGTQQCVQKIGKFGEVEGLTDRHELRGNNDGFIDTRYNLGDFNWTYFCVVCFDTTIGGVQAFGNSGLDANFIIRINPVGALQAVIGDRYRELQDTYDGLAHVIAIRYTANSVSTGSIDYFLDDIDSGIPSYNNNVNLSGVPDTTIRLLARGEGNEPLSNGSFVGSNSVEFSALSDTRISNKIAQLKAEHNIL